MIVTDVTFNKLLEYLDQRFQVITLDMLLKGNEEGRDQSRPCCLLTFDDGWKDTYTRAYPSLKKFGMPATVFISTGSVGKSRGFWVEQLKQAWSIASSRTQMLCTLGELTEKNTNRLELDNLVEWLKHMPTASREFFLLRLLPKGEQFNDAESFDSMLTWEEVIELSRNGIEIGAHTVNHPLLTYENDIATDEELVLSKQMLEKMVGKPVHAFAYPNGDCDERVRRSVQKTGYRYGFTTQPGWYRCGQDPFTIRRILLHEGNMTGPDGQFSPAMFSFTLSGRP